eukprot:TRINITY_DN12288_c2_g1_i2.p1 TRINITY_DN12288_c2_g1~~TRINITY_DN12288_c2_g1_i2.p1  ORF type:complete len:169 (+),score=19.60 TRINITY_DN12288_c2_g1_i2:541-1047(+)
MHSDYMAGLALQLLSTMHTYDSVHSMTLALAEAGVREHGDGPRIVLHNGNSCSANQLLAEASLGLTSAYSATEAELCQHPSEASTSTTSDPERPRSWQQDIQDELVWLRCTHDRLAVARDSGADPPAAMSPKWLACLGANGARRAKSHYQHIQHRAGKFVGTRAGHNG